jgi:cyanophycin synthetase
MLLQSVRVLRGPNLWLNDTALEAVLELPIDAGVAPLSAAFDAVVGAVPAVLLPLPSSDAALGGREKLVHLVAILTFRMQPRIAHRASEMMIVPTREPNVFRIVVPYAEESVGRRAIEASCNALDAAFGSAAMPNLEAIVEQLRRIDADVRLGPSTHSIARAAQQQGIPVRRLTTGSLLQLGHGSRLRRVWAAETDQTSVIAEGIAQDKDLTKALLNRAFLPVPAGYVVTNRASLWNLAQRIGTPVVIKPQKGNQGRGVSVGLCTREAVEAAYDGATTHSPEVLLEKHIVGHDYRLLVVGDKLVAAARREPPKVTGDGKQTIRELVALENSNPLRGDDHSTVLSKIPVDDIALEMLRDQGLEPETIVEAGRVVQLRGNGNLSTGGTATDVTDEVHPAVAKMAVEAAKVVGLDIAGIDFVAPNVNTTPAQSGGAIVEVNAAPGLRMHLEPSAGKGRPVGEAIVQSLFPKRESRRVPIVAVTGTNGKTTTTRLVAHLLRQQRLRVGMTCTDGVFVESRRIDSGDCSGPQSARNVLSHPEVDAAVLETARGGMLREGLGFDWCDVAIVTNVAEGDHLGLGGIHTVEELARLKAVPVRRVAPSGVAILNAGDPLTAAMVSQCPAESLLFSHDARCPALVKHRERGGWVATVRGQELVIERGSYSCRLGNVAEFPLTHGGKIAFQVENILAAAAAGFWLGLTPEQLRQGLRTFIGDLGSAPGRFNVLVHEERTVVLDYGHNVSALRALVDAVKAFGACRNTVVYTAAGDRRDQDIREQGEILADFFDEIFTYEDQCRRGRAAGEVTRLLCEGIHSVRRQPKIKECNSEVHAIETALRELRPGELLLCQVDQVDEMLEFVTEWLTSQERQGADRRSEVSVLRRS